MVYIEVDSGGVLITSFSDTTEAIAAEATILHTFSTPYHVPEFNADSMMYTVRVFLQASDEDVDLSNDTLSVETYALNDVSIDAFGRVNWTMEQNIPNPASAATRIAYSIPQEGIIHFTITTIADKYSIVKIFHPPPELIPWNSTPNIWQEASITTAWNTKVNASKKMTVQK